MREHGSDTFAQFPVLMGEPHLPHPDGGHATLTGATRTVEALHVISGVYEVTTNAALPFLYTLTDDTVIVTPGSSASVAPEHDSASVRALLTTTADSAKAAATVAADESIANWDLPIGSATNFGRAARGFPVASPESAFRSFVDRLVTYRYTAMLAAEQYNGPLDKEWMPVQGLASLTVTIPVDETGAPPAPQASIHTSDLVWGAAG